MKTGFAIAAGRTIANCAFAFLFLCPLPALAAGLPSDLAQAVKDYDQANIRSDVTTLGRLFADDYMLVNSDATVEDKRQALADFLVPGFRIDPYVMQQPVEIAWRDGAVVSGIVHLGWTQDGKHQTRLLRIAHVWAKRDGQWQMKYTQVTRIPQ